MDSTEIFKNKKLMPFLAMLCALLWALAFPFIKLGYRELCIASDDTGSKLLFAGIRFFFAGVLVLLVAGKGKLPNGKTSINVWKWLLLFAVVNIFLHYLCSYIGLGYVPSSRGAVIDSSNTFLLILLSCLFFADDRMTPYKALGCLLGFGGIILINIRPGEPFLENVSFLGDGMMILDALFAALGGIINRIVSKKMNMTVATGMSMVIGGALLLLVAGIIRPASAWNLSAKGIALLVALTLISAIGFGIYNSLIAYHPISKVAIFNAFIPVFGVIFSSFILGERFELTYLAAGLMVTAGTVLARK